jgi:hypothetical protein
MHPAASPMMITNRNYHYLQITVIALRSITAAVKLSAADYIKTVTSRAFTLIVDPAAAKLILPLLRTIN